MGVAWWVGGAAVFSEVVESLCGNAVFIAKLVGSGNYILVHPMTEEGAVFLPCCYGYSTTVRRAQGLSLKLGCIYMDQKKRAAGRGYAYVAVSRFQTRCGCHLYGKVRRSDFLPVGEEKEDEVLTRGIESESESGSDTGGFECAGWAGAEDIFDCIGALDEGVRLQDDFGEGGGIARDLFGDGDVSGDPETGGPGVLDDFGGLGPAEGGLFERIEAEGGAGSVDDGAGEGAEEGRDDFDGAGLADDGAEEGRGDFD